MKKTLKVLSLVLVAALSMVLLVACDISSKPETVQKKLEGKGYEVEITKDAEDLAGIAEMYGLEEGDITAMLMAGKYDEEDEDNDGEYISVIFFKNSATAKKFTDSDLYKQMHAPNGGEKGRAGSVVYVGTAQAVKDAK